MSQVKIRNALETAVNGIAPSLLTAWENMAFPSVPTTTPFQRVFLLFAAPDDSTLGAAEHIENGFMQINLAYPLQSGDGAARTRAELVKTVFYRGASFTSGGVTVIINRTPEVSGGFVDNDHWVVPVKIRFRSTIFS